MTVRPLRVLFAVHGLPPERRAGVELLTDGLARALSRRGHAVAVVLRGEGRRGLVSEARDGYEAIRLDLPRRKRRFLDLYEDERVDALFGGALARFRPDVFHAQHLIGLSLGVLERARAARVPVVLSLHDFWLGCPRGQRVREDRGVCAEVDRDRCAECLRPEWQGIHRDAAVLARLARNLFTRRPARRILAEYDATVAAALRRADLVLTPSEWYRREYARWYALDPERIRAVPPGMPHAPAVRAARGGKSPGAPFTVGYVGSLVPTKGVHVLADAFARIARPGFRLAVHGRALPFFTRKGEDYESELRALAARARAGNDAVFGGPYDAARLPGILASFDLLAVPSIWPEAYSLTLREGRLAGLPVVASRIGALEEAVVDGETGLLVEPGDVDALRAAIERVAGDADLRDRLSSAAGGATGMEEHAAAMEALYERARSSGSSALRGG